MNPTIDILMKRKSVRTYLDQPINSADRDTILQAAVRAPTAGNMMLYSIIEVDEQALKDRLAVTCDDQPFIAKAPFVLIFLADYQRWYDYYLSSGVPELCAAKNMPMRALAEGDLMLAACDALIAAQQAVVAAEAIGIGSCYIGDILEQYETHRDLLILPRYVLPVAMVCFGYPSPEAAARQQPDRFGLEFILHRNRYQQLDSAALERMMQPRNDDFRSRAHMPEGIENVGQFNYARKFSAEFSYEMSRSVKAMIDSWCENP